MRRFATAHVPEVGDFVCLDEGVSHHLLRVTGIAPGEEVELFDGTGLTAVAELVDVRAGLAQLRILSHDRPGQVQTEIHLMMSQLRANVLDTVLRMATELGVSSITMVQAERCVARGDKRERWNRIVQSAAAQSGRAVWPSVHPPVTFDEALTLGDKEIGLICVPGTVEPLATTDNTVRLLIGPEGGWSEAELGQAAQQGWLARGLGEQVLRADTAAIAAIVRCSGQSPIGPRGVDGCPQ